MAVKKVSAVTAPTPGTVTMRRHVSLPRARRINWSSSALLRSPATRHAASNAAMAARTSGSLGQPASTSVSKVAPLLGASTTPKVFKRPRIWL